MDHLQAAALTNKMITALAAAIAEGKVIELRGLGTFEVQERKTYKAHNPRSMAPVDIPARRAVIFRPSGKLKAAVKTLEAETAAPEIT
jgi:nucleoid DNA-binding protein